MNDLDIDKPPEKTRVVVAMSGGVDSSVVAGLMKARGYETLGVTLQLYDHGAALHRKGACCAGQDIDDARRVAQELGIAHYVLDYESRFSDAVIENFADSYVRGETPVPCVTCNQTVKFNDLLSVAKDLDADVLATGHYIQSTLMDNGHRAMLRPLDADRDQSYFLFATTQKQLDFLRFPLGGMTKAETRAQAEKMGLAIADKSDSQDICFVPFGHYAAIVEKLRPGAAEPGDIRHLDGRILGTHKGIIHYTIGQRRGLGISSTEPLYVIKLDPENSVVIVGPHEALATGTIYLRNVNWLGDDILDDGMECAVKIRSTRGPHPAKLYCQKGQWRVELAEADFGVSAGQACVFYAGLEPDAQILGGGWITHTGSMVRAA